MALWHLWGMRRGKETCFQPSQALPSVWRHAVLLLVLMAGLCTLISRQQHRSLRSLSGFDLTVISVHNTTRLVMNSSKLDISITTSAAWSPSKAQAAVAELAQLGGQAKPAAAAAAGQQRRWRSLICTNVRNDIHLREFLTRTLLLGFSHIVVYDNNQILAGMDYNISLVVEPFVKAGLVTHLPFQQDGSHKYLHNNDKGALLHECFDKFGRHADWVIGMDTDEYFYISKPAATPGATSRITAGGSSGYATMFNHGSAEQELASSSSSSVSSSSSRPGQVQATTSLGIMNTFLDEVEHSSALENVCALRFPWRMMYGERRVLKSSGLLLDAFPRICFSHEPKTLFRSGAANPKPPHDAGCKAFGQQVLSVDSAAFKAALPQYTTHLLHYYARSVEEYITKSEQSMPPYFRQLVDSYDKARTCSFEPVPFDPQYTNAVHSLMAQLRKAQGGLGDGGVQLGPPPECKPLSRDDYLM